MTTGKAVRDQSGVDVWKKIAPYGWLSLCLLVFGLALFAVYIWKAEKLVALGLAGSVYYLVLVLFAVSVAVILFGALRTYADYSGRYFGGVLKMSGPIVGVLVLVVLGFVLPPPSSNFPLTVYVHGPGTAPTRPKLSAGGALRLSFLKNSQVM